jgi:hypothetical protein
VQGSTPALLELRFFRSLPFYGAMLAVVTALCGYGSLLFLNTLYLQDVRGFSAPVTRLCTLPVGVLIVVLSPLTGRIVVRAEPGCCCWSPAPRWLRPGSPRHD